MLPGNRYPVGLSKSSDCTVDSTVVQLDMSSIDNKCGEWMFCREQVWKFDKLTKWGIVNPPTTMYESF